MRPPGTMPGRGDLAVLGLLWAAMAALFVWDNLGAIAGMNMPDGDDYLRLQQVRDWLAGQGWFDVSQHRINPPVGGAMHWSRVLDIPLALGIAALSPVFGRPGAEMIVSVAAPMLVMGLAMLLVAAIAGRLVGRAWGPLAAMSVPMSVLTYPQIMPLRIDHHGWQLVFALMLLWALMDETRKLRSGALAGAAAALWLNNSIEGLPIAACAAVVLGVRWLLDARELPRLQAYLWTLALASFALETATAPGVWSSVECDRLSQPYLFVFAAAAIAAAVAAHPFMQHDWRARLGVASLAGVAAFAAFAASGTRCFAGPFADLEPLVRAVWLDNVGESKTLIGRGLGAFVTGAGFSALGCAGAAFAFRSAREGRDRRCWATVFALSLAAASLMLVMSRAGAVAHAFAAPGAAFIARALFMRVRALASMPLRALGAAVALMAATPALPQFALWLDHEPGARSSVCRGDLSALNALEQSLLFAPLDIGPMIVARTPHSVVATAHHRNHAAMNEVISAFTGTPEAARALISARRAHYVVLCEEAPEIRTYVRHAPDGFAAQLAAGPPPTWLEPVALSPPLPGFHIYRVLDDAG